MSDSMKKTILIYGLALAAAAVALQWLDYLYAVKLFATEIYIVLIAVIFTAIGIWAGNRLTGRPAPPGFEKNIHALQSLGISEREYEVLKLLAEGHSNQEIADSLFVSANTVKTHLAHLYDKLGVARRTQAIRTAKALSLIP